MTTNVYKNFEKVVVNTGLGRISAMPNFSDKILPSLEKEFAIITGQKPTARPATKSISGFKLREGTIVGLKATLRRARMAQFLEKVMKVVLPRVRDFRGLNVGNVDSNGNLTFVIKDYSVFPEISQEASKTSFGVEITVVPKAIESRDKAIELYRTMGVPFSKEAGDKKQVTKKKQ